MEIYWSPLEEEVLKLMESETRDTFSTGFIPKASMAIGPLISETYTLQLAEPRPARALSFPQTDGTFSTGHHLLSFLNLPTQSYCVTDSLGAYWYQQVPMHALMASQWALFQVPQQQGTEASLRPSERGRCYASLSFRSAQSVDRSVSVSLHHKTQS